MIIERKEMEQVLGPSARRTQKREQQVRESTKYVTTVPRNTHLRGRLSHDHAQWQTNSTTL